MFRHSVNINKLKGKRNLKGDTDCSSTALQTFLTKQQPSSPISDLGKIAEIWMTICPPAVRIRKCCERALRWPAWRSSSAAPVMALRVRVSYPGGGGCAQVRRSSGLAFQGRNRSSAFPLSGFPPLRPHSSR